MQPAHQTLVIEDAVIERRVRRPADLGRFAAVLVAIASILLLGYIASKTTSGLGADITQGANRLPSLLIWLANFVSGLGVLVLPGVVTLDLIIRKRLRQLVESIGAFLGATFVLIISSWIITSIAPERLVIALAGTADRADAIVFSVVLGALSGFITVARLMSRGRWNIAAIAVIGSIALADIINGGITATGLAVSVLVGWAVGLLIRYLLGTETTRPSGAAIAETMAAIGHPLTILRAAEVLDAGRRYDATTTDGARLDLVVLDRDLEGAGLGTAIYRSLRLRDDPGAAGTSMRRRLERTALNSWAIATAAISTPNLIAVAEVGSDAAVLAFEHVGGRTFASIDDGLGDAELLGAWDILASLQAARIAHRALYADNLVLGQEGKVNVIGLEDGAIAASDILLRIDIAELLVTLSMLVGHERAITSGRVMFGEAGLVRALPALQSVAFSTTTRSRLKAHRGLLGDLREALLGLTTPDDIEEVNIERIKPRTLATIAAGTIAAYVLLTQLASVNLLAVASSADPRWAIVAVLASISTYFGAALTLIGSVPARLSFWKSFKAQWAASFATLVAPPTLGSVAINVRYLTSNGLSSALAATCVAVVQVFSFLSHIALLLLAVVFAGTSHDFAFRPPKNAILGFAVFALALAVSASVPAVRRIIANRVRPILSSVIPRMASLINQPTKLGAGLGGMVILNVGYCVALIASVKAFLPEAPIAAVAVVYLAGSVVGQAAPTPGGIGAMEAAIAAGLTAAGIDGAVAVSGTLLFRVATFWLPTIPGWLAFRSLQRSGDL